LAIQKNVIDIKKDVVDTHWGCERDGDDQVICSEAILKIKYIQYISFSKTHRVLDQSNTKVLEIPGTRSLDLIPFTYKNFPVIYAENNAFGVLRFDLRVGIEDVNYEILWRRVVRGSR